MIQALRDITTYVHVQLYNSTSIIGLDGQYYNMGTKQGIVAMCEMLLKGFHVGAYYTGSTDASTYFAPLRPDQVVIGVPSSASAAGSGQISNAKLQEAFTELDRAYPGIRGIMTWSINWDSAQNQNSFAKENQEFLQTFRETQEEMTTEKESMTEEPTTEEVKVSEIVISDKVDVEGYQVSTTLGGTRVIGSVESTINQKKVKEWGIVYALTESGDTKYPVTEEDMYIGTDNPYVTAMTSTENGTLDVKNNGDTDTVYFVRTTLFKHFSPQEFTAEYKVRTFALLEDNTYVYSNVYSYSVYDIAHRLYQEKKMSNLSAHQYLYDSILKVVDGNYKEVDYNWQNEIIGADYQ